MPIGFVGGQVVDAVGITNAKTINFALTGGEAGYADTAPQTGDVVLVCIADASTANRGPIVESAGYQVVSNALYQNDSADSTSVVYGKKLQGAEPSVQIGNSLTTASTHGRVVSIRVYRGVDDAILEGAILVTAGGINGININPPSVPATPAGTRLVIFGAAAVNLANYTSTLTPSPSLGNKQAGNGPASATYSALVASGDFVSTGAVYDAGLFATPRQATQDSWTAHALALKVATGGVPTGPVPKVWNGTDWVVAKTKVWDGTSWVEQTFTIY